MSPFWDFSKSEASDRQTARHVMQSVEAVGGYAMSGPYSVSKPSSSYSCVSVSKKSL